MIGSLGLIPYLAKMARKKQGVDKIPTWSTVAGLLLIFGLAIAFILLLHNSI